MANGSPPTLGGSSKPKPAINKLNTNNNNVSSNTSPTTLKLAKPVKPLKPVVPKMSKLNEDKATIGHQILGAILDDKPADVKEMFNVAVKATLADMVDAYKSDLASSMFSNEPEKLTVEERFARIEGKDLVETISTVGDLLESDFINTPVDDLPELKEAIAAYFEIKESGEDTDEVAKAIIGLMQIDPSIMEELISDENVTEDELTEAFESLFAEIMSLDERKDDEVPDADDNTTKGTKIPPYKKKRKAEDDEVPDIKEDTETLEEARKQTDKIVNAFLDGKKASGKNTKTDGENIWLHGNHIARKHEGRIYVSAAGWATPTTMERLNGIAQHSSGSRPFNIKGGKVHYHGTPVDSKEWIDTTVHKNHKDYKPFNGN